MASDPYVRPLLQAMLVQFVLLGFFAMVLDGGILLSACRFSSVGFWAGVILILVRRPARPSRSDLVYIKIGLLPIVALAIPAFAMVWKFKEAI